MRLINVKTLILEEFMVVRPETLQYAILSHTWEDGEVTFQDYMSPDLHMMSMKGFGKIEKTCELARRDGIPYAWVDTCCIDKTNSAELTEAINSMFNWYRDAKVCYAWLADLPNPTEEPIEASLRRCRWFTRGWTLQELLAPRRVEFYDCSWNFRGTKKDLKELVADASKIGAEVLENPEGLYRLPIAQRMSWAASRQTTRLEDMAYCLIGIFEVNMPMLYGEGERAFLRLQEEIVKDTNDLSIFAWKVAAESQKYHGIFARSPSEFRDCGSLRLIDSTVYSPEFSLSNKGLRIQTETAVGLGGAHFLKLNCKARAGAALISIWLHHHGGEVYSRSRAHEYGEVTSGGERDPRRHQTKSIYVLKQLDALRSRDLEASHRHAFVFRKNLNTMLVTQFPHFPFVASPIEPSSSWDSTRCMLHTAGVDQFNGFAYFSPPMEGGATVREFQMAGEWFIVAFGKYQDEDKPWVTVHGKEDVYGLWLMEVGTKDLQRMGKMARESSLGRQPSVVLKDFEKRPFKKITAELVEGELDGQAVYFIDLEIEDAPRSKPKNDPLEWKSPYIDYSKYGNASSRGSVVEDSEDEGQRLDISELFDEANE